jgi:protein-disulfide isomerase
MFCFKNMQRYWVSTWRRQTRRDNRFRAKIDRDKGDGQALGVRQTPTFFVNGRKLMQFSESALRRLIDEENAN